MHGLELREQMIFIFTLMCLSFEDVLEFEQQFVRGIEQLPETKILMNHSLLIINTTLKETHGVEYNNSSIIGANWDSSYTVFEDVHNYINMSYSELCSLTNALTNVLIDFSKETGSDNSMGTIDYQYGIR